jgi:hypothetical protein
MGNDYKGGSQEIRRVVPLPLSPPQLASSSIMQFSEQRPVTPGPAHNRHEASS